MGKRIPKREILKKLDAKCESCGGQNELTIHHKTPSNMGGDHKAENLVILCLPCHHKQHGTDKSMKDLR